MDSRKKQALQLLPIVLFILGTTLGLLLATIAYVFPCILYVFIPLVCIALIWVTGWCCTHLTSLWLASMDETPKPPASVIEPFVCQKKALPVPSKPNKSELRFKTIPFQLNFD